MPSITAHQRPTRLHEVRVAHRLQRMPGKRLVREDRVRGFASNGPHGDFERATVSMWPYEVPPSEIIR
jgi:hypothetical protein